MKVANSFYVFARANLGTIACIAVATFFVFLFHSSPFKAFAPFLFIPVIALIAGRFGTWVGILCTIVSTAIFAAFLFEPVFSGRVTNTIQRDNLVWMVIGGVALSEILGVQPPTRTKSDGKNV